MADTMREELVLGLDIGARSVGWAILNLKDSIPSLVAAGARVFPLGVDEESFESRNLQRRAARLRRRMLARRRMRLAAVARLLQRNGYLPNGEISNQQPSIKSVLEMDPYKLRAEGLRRKLHPFEFGRAIYHLAHRRGFKSNRKRVANPDEQGIVKREIQRLEADWKQSGAETIGEYLARLNPQEQRIRGRSTSRDWFRAEFDLLIDRQRSLGQHLPDSFVHSLKRAIFFQRKVWWDPATIGMCEFEPKRPRLRVSHPLYQRFRILQAVNHLSIRTPGKLDQKLTPAQRDLLLQELEKVEELTFAKIRSLLKLPRGTTFNLEEGGEKRLIGNRTAARIRKAIGPKWDSAPESVRAQIYEAVASIEDEDLLKRLALKKPWGLTEEEAEALSEVVLEDDRGALSSLAIRRLLPHMESGLTYAEAVHREYPNRMEGPQVDQLPPVENLRNPTAQRAMNEMRRVVNAIIRKYGIPGKIRIELARDLKLPKQKRVERWKEMRKREAQREAARKKILDEAGIKNPSAADIEKALLFEECGGICPYTGRGIPFAQLFGPDALFEVEHIIPWSRSLDNSFANKTLCARDANREKHNKTPYEAFSGNPARYGEILGRVKKFKGPFAEEKLRRFQCENPEGPESAFLIWSGADLHATSLAARRAAKYLARLYPPEERKSRIQVSAGRTTAQLRAAWNLNRILGCADEKNRADYRHHAIDAIVVALTTPALTRELSIAAERARRPGTYVGMSLPPPLYAQIEQAIQTLLVSHRVDRRIQGPLHKETHYGVIRKGGQAVAVVRKPLQDLEKEDIDRIVDTRIQEIVRAATGDKEPKVAFADPAKLPVLNTSTGKAIRIRRVRIIADNVRPENLIDLEPARRVAGGGNHHLEIFSTKDKKGNETWRCEIVSRFEAMRRRRMNEPIIRKQDEFGNPLVCTLCIGDTVLMKHGDKQIFAVVQKLSDGDYTFREVSDGRKASQIKKPIRLSNQKLFMSGLQKLSVTPLGDYRRAHD